MKTKNVEQIFTTSDTSAMNGLYLAERLCREWLEDFVDKDTGETVQVKRREHVLSKGELISGDNLAQISFLLQSGDIKEVEVSDQQRLCDQVAGSTSLWQAQILLNQKKRTLYLYANCIDVANAITTDFVEQKFSGYFRFLGLKQLDYSNLLSDSDADEVDVLDIYKIEIELTEGYDSFESDYIVRGTDAENCKKIIFDFITAQRINENRSLEFSLKIISAKTIPCHNIIDPEFCCQYLETAN